MAPQSVGIIYKHDHEPARNEAEKLSRWFEKKGITCFLEEMEAEETPDRSGEKATTIPNTVNWLVVLGGDGTLLGAARMLGRHGLPILGVNLGGLGFLTGIPLEQLYPAIEMMIEGHLDVESRVMLENRVIREGKEIRRYEGF